MDSEWTGKTIFVLKSTVANQVKTKEQTHAFLAERSMVDLSKSGKKKATGKQFNYEKENEETRKGINGSRKAEWLKWEKFNLSPEVRSYRKWSFILKDDGSGKRLRPTNQLRTRRQIDQLQQGAYMASAAVRRVCSVHAVDMVAQDSCTFNMVHFHHL